jgi:hypothetical protein
MRDRNPKRGFLKLRILKIEYRAAQSIGNAALS